MDHRAVPKFSRAPCHTLSSSGITVSTLLHLEKVPSLQTQVVVALHRGPVSQTEHSAETEAHVLQHLSCHLMQGGNSLQFSESGFLLNIFDI